jgi:hypothetical protein
MWAFQSRHDPYVTDLDAPCFGHRPALTQTYVGVIMQKPDRFCTLNLRQHINIEGAEDVAVRAHNRIRTVE